ncbi:TPA: hypothetical protein TUT13_000981 [Streptococcus equi subsp. zooepidemicus]|nr:hypothetical protein [Streptococcus equi subsp. zooepidemicus]
MDDKNKQINVMKSKRETIYKETLEYYGYTSLKKNELDKIRKKISRSFKEEFPDQEWSDLTENKKLSFWVSLQDYMFEKTNLPFPKTIKSKIENDIKKYLLDIEVEGRRYNQRIDELFTINEETGRRPYDDVMSAIYDEPEQRRYAPRMEVLETKISAILKILEDEFNYFVDEQGIEESLLYIHNFDRASFEKLDLEIDESQNLSCEERGRKNKIIEENKKYLYHKKKLKELDFITYRED